MAGRGRPRTGPIFGPQTKAQWFASLPRRQVPLNLRQKRTVKRLINGQLEKKYYDVFASATSVTSTGAAGDISAVPNAAAPNTSGREGTMIQAKSLQIDMQLTGIDTAGNQVRIIIFQWQDNDAANPVSVAEILQQVSITPAMAQLAWDNLDDGTLKILHDKCYQLAGQGVEAGGTPSIITFRLLFTGKELHKHNIDYGIAGATTGNNHYYLFAISDSAAATHPLMAYNARLIYTDA